MQVASDWLNSIISTAPLSLTGSRVEYPRVIAIIVMVE